MQTGSDAFPQGKAGMKRAYGILENHLQLSVQFFLPTGRQMGDIVAIEENLPTVGLGELADEPAQCTFSRPAFSDDSHDFCFLQLKRNIIDGTEITGESEIPKAHKRIAKMMMLPKDAPATQGAVEAITEADVLIFGPGSLYTSVIPNLLVDGIREAILASKAVKIYICNVMTQPGETDGYGAYEHVQALIKHMGAQFLDYVIVNDQDITVEQLRQYDAKGSMPITPDVNKIRSLGITVVPARLISKHDLVRHDPRKLARVLIALIYRLRLFGRGMQFFDYFFMRQGMRKMKQQEEQQ